MSFCARLRLSAPFCGSALDPAIGAAAAARIPPIFLLCSLAHRLSNFGGSGAQGAVRTERSGLSVLNPLGGGPGALVPVRRSGCVFPCGPQTPTGPDRISSGSWGEPRVGKVDFKEGLETYWVPRDRFEILDVPPPVADDRREQGGTGPGRCCAAAGRVVVGEGHGRLARDNDQGRWTMMLMVPDWCSAPVVAAAFVRAGAKEARARLADVRLAPLFEGRCAQTLQRIHDEFIPPAVWGWSARTFDTRLSDFRRSAPESLRTRPRQPSGCRRAPVSRLNRSRGRPHRDLARMRKARRLPGLSS